jgi:hypothetical protein
MLLVQRMSYARAVLLMGFKRWNNERELWAPVAPLPREKPYCN